VSPLPLLLDRSVVTKGVIDMLDAATPYDIGDGHAPDPPPGQEAPTMPYLVVLPIDSPVTVERDFYDRTPGHVLTYQVDAVAAQRDAAEFAASVAHAVVLTRASSGAFLYAVAPPTGWKVNNRDLDTEGGAPREGPLVVVPNRYKLWLTPA
jgi:hypothetical protein